MKLRLNRKNTIGLIFFLAFIISTSLIFQFEERFSAEDWKANPTSRYNMVDDLIESHVLLGKSKFEVLEILGEPNSILQNKRDIILYNIGRAPSFNEQQEDQLLVEFFEDTVILVSLAIE